MFVFSLLVSCLSFVPFAFFVDTVFPWRRFVMGGAAAAGLVAAGLDRADSLGAADSTQGTAGPAAVYVLTLAGFCFWMAALHWLRLPHSATSFGWVALSFYFAFYLPVFVGLSRVAVHRLRVPVILAAPVVWTGLELARAHLLTGMTMASLGHTQYRWIELIQLSDLAGAYGVSFVVMFVAACAGEDAARATDDRWALWPLAPAAVVLAAALLYGHVRIDANSTHAGPRIALIQGSIDIEMRYDPEHEGSHLRKSISTCRERPSSRIAAST